MENQGMSRRDTIAVIALIISTITLCIGNNLYNQFTGHSIFSGELPFVKSELPKSTPSLPVFSNLGARVQSLRFFESGKGEGPSDQQVYPTVFYKGTARYINWRLDLEHPAPDRAIDFTIHTVYRRADGSVLAEFDQSTYILDGWTSSYHAAGWGGETPGSWEAGGYTVVLYIDNIEIARAAFVIE
jgi:hypothetical protein